MALPLKTLWSVGYEEFWKYSENKQVYRQTNLFERLLLQALPSAGGK